MKQIKKGVILVMVLVGLILLGLILEYRNLPPSNQYKDYVISGKVVAVDEIVGIKPDYVSVYYNNPLCINNAEQISKIKWLDNSTGQFEIYFTAPAGLKEVIITTSCNSPESKNINLKDIPVSVELILGRENVDGNALVNDDLDKLSSISEEIMLETEDKLNQLEGKFLTQEEQFIKDDISNVRKERIYSKRSTDSNEKLLYVYYAEWFALRAKYRFELYSLNQSLRKIEKILNSHSNGCYVPDYNAYKDYISANKSYFYLKNSNLLEKEPHYIKDFDILKQQILYANSNANGIENLVRMSDKSFEIINGTFEFQRPYCEKRDKIVKITVIYWAFVFVYMGILIEMGFFGKLLKLINRKS